MNIARQVRPESSIDYLICPNYCGTVLLDTGESFSCSSCQLNFPVVDGIPVMLKSAATRNRESDDFLKHKRMAYESLEHYNEWYKQRGDFDRALKADQYFIRRLFTHLRLPVHPKILDIGAGSGYYGRIVKSLFDEELFSCDLAIEGLRQGKQAGLKKLFVMDAYALAFQDNFFDAIFAFGLNSFMKDDPTEFIDLLARLTRTLAPGGPFVYVFSTNLRQDSHQFGYSHTPKFVQSVFERSNLFETLELYCFIRPLAHLYGPLLLNPITTAVTQAVQKIVSMKKPGIRLVAIARKK